MGKSISIKNLYKTFTSGNENVQALKDVSLEIGDGEFFTMLGPSGCGKTTLLRCIAGLETPDQGEITFGDDILFSSSPYIVIPPYKRKIGMVFQSYAIWPHMTVSENVAYPLKYGENKKYNKKEIADRVMSSLNRVQMENLADRPATQLSGGQQQRVALARALVNDPQVILLDEPLVNLDAKLREVMRIELRDLLHGLGTTVIYVTHDQAESLTMSDRIAILLDGRIEQVGNPREIYDCPISEFVADFIGTTNLLDGVVQSSPETTQLKSLKTKIGIIQCKQSSGLSDGKQVKLVIRPENIDLSTDLELNTQNSFQGRVKNLEFLGESIIAFVEINKETLLIKTHPSISISIDQLVRVTLPVEHCCVLNEYGD